MEMTIDEAIKVIHKMLAYTDLNVRENLNADMIDACHMAIDTMCKYQKIKEYISIPNRYGTMAEDCQKLEYVRKVMEDGNDD